MATPVHGDPQKDVKWHKEMVGELALISEIAGKFLAMVKTAPTKLRAQMNYPTYRNIDGLGHSNAHEEAQAVKRIFEEIKRYMPSAEAVVDQIIRDTARYQEYRKEQSPIVQRQAQQRSLEM